MRHILTYLCPAIWREQTGAAMLDGGLLKWYGFTVPLPLIVVAVAEVGLMGAVEKYRSSNDGPAGFDLDESCGAKVDVRGRGLDCNGDDAIHGVRMQV